MASKRALLVAINDYGSQQNNLPSCLEDAARFRSLLGERYGFTDFQELYDGEATVANVEAGLGWLFENVAEDDRLVFFYSGHGFQQPKGENLEECLVCGDMKFLFDDRLTELSQSAPPGVLTVVLDSCFSGGMQKRIALDGRVEVARTKAWMPPPNAALQQQKILTGRPLVPRPFGCAQVTSAAGVKQLVLGRNAGGPQRKSGGAAQGEDETDQVMLNGVLLSACSENETASASSSATEGLSAFSFALHQTLDASEGEPTISALHEAARAKLQELGFQQTPLLKAPDEPVGLADAPFITLGAAAAAPAQPAKGPRKAVATGAKPNGQAATSAARPAQQPASRPTAQPTTRPATGATPVRGNGAVPSPAQGAEEAEGTGTAQATGNTRPPPRQPAASARPSTLPDEEVTTMDTMQQGDEKWIGLAAGIAASVLPQVISAVRRRKDFAPDAPAIAAPASSGAAMPEADEKWVAALAQVAVPAAISAVPGIIRAVRGKELEAEASAKAATAVSGNGAYDPDDAEQKWVAALARVAVPAAINAVPGIINAIRGKEADFAPTTPAMPMPRPMPAPTNGTVRQTMAGDEEGDEKFLPLALGVAASLVPEIVRAVRRRKDFDPDLAPDLAPADKSAADAEDKWVAALARVAVPAAINAVPGIINAIRGKEAGLGAAGKIYPPPSDQSGRYSIAAF